MGFWQRIRERLAPVEKRDAAFYGLSPALGEIYAHGGVAADRLATVASCVRLISGAMSSMPPLLVTDGDAGQEPAPATATAWNLLRRPAQRHSWPAWMAWVARSLLLDGNAVLWLQTDGRGAITSLTPIPWSWLSPQMVGRRLVYDVWNRHPEAQIIGLPDRLVEDEVLHIRGQSDAGLIGQSILSRARGPIREGAEIERLAEANWRNGLRPSAVFTAPNYLPDNQRTRAKQNIEDYTGSINAGRTPLIEGGWSLQTLSLSSVDAEFLASRQWNTTQICALFGVPELLLHIGQRLPSDMAPFITQFAQLALAPLASAIESEFSYTVLPDGMRLRIDLDGLMRGSFSAVVAGLAALTQSGIITPNDARAELDWPPHPDGDALQRNGAPDWPADGAGMPALHPSPGPTGDMPPMPGTNEGEGAG
jgi:HK97 family phage portal protein